MSATSERNEAPKQLYVYQLTLLGGFSLSVNGRTLKSVTAPRLQSLLSYLILNAHKQLDRSYLASLFWPELSEEMARGHLRKTLFKLKECLPAGDEPVEFSKSAIEWRAQFSCDVLELETLLDGPVSQDKMRRVLQRYAGELLPGCTDAWCLQRREMLKNRVLTAMDELGNQLETRRQYGETAELMLARLNLDPVHEESWFRLFRMRLALGDRSAAQRAWVECKSILAQELDVEPGLDFAQAVHQLSRQPERADASSERIPLVGRVSEWNALLSAWQQATKVGMRWVLIHGVAGIGKTRLADEMLYYVEHQSHRAATATCVTSDQSSAFAALAMLLRALPAPAGPPALLAEVARLVPELHEKHPNLPDVQSLNEPGQRQRFFQAISRYLLEHEPLLLLLDDVQWCDDATLEFVHFFVRSYGHRKVLWIATLRVDDAPTSGQLPQELLPTLRRLKVLTELSLGPLSQQESSTLLLAEAKEELSIHVLESLYSEAEGTPLYLLELLRARHLHAQSAVMAGQYPQTLTEAVAVRCSVLSPGARLVLDVLAVVEGTASAELLAIVCERPELEVLQDLDDLLRRRLIEERPDASVRFAHGLIGSIVYRLLSLPKRRTLHRRIAEALSTHAEALRALALQIAAQFESANIPDKAGHYLIAAGERAILLAEHHAACQHFNKALSFPFLTELDQLNALKGLTHANIMLGDFQRAFVAIERSLPLAKSLGDSHSYAMGLVHKGHVLQRLGRHDEADEPLAEALSVMPSGEELSLMQAHIQRAELALHRLKLDTVWEDSEQVYACFLRLAEKNNESSVRISGCVPLIWTGRMEKAAALCEEALQLAIQQERRDWIGMARYWRSHLIISQGRYEEAEHELIQAIQTAQACDCNGHMLTFQSSLGVMMGLRGKFRGAMHYFGMSLDGSDAAQHPNAEAGYLAAHFGDYERAWSILTTLLTKVLTSASLWRHLRMYTRLCSVAVLYGKLEDAEFYHQKCAALFPQNTWLQTAPSEGVELNPWALKVPACVSDLRILCLHNYGGLLFKQGKLQEALPYVREASRLRPYAQIQLFEWDPHFTLAELYLALDRPKDAQHELDHIQHATGGNPLSHTGLARFYGLRWQAARALRNHAAAEEALSVARRHLHRMCVELDTSEARRKLREDLSYHAILGVE